MSDERRAVAGAPPVRVEREGAVALLTIDRPPVNAMSAGVVADLERALDELAGDDKVRVLIIRGEGERAFSAGADISEFPKLLEPDGVRAERIPDLADRIEVFPRPVLAAIRGYCLGGGLEIALACDVRIAAEDARIGLPEIKLGLLPGGGGTQRLPRLVGPGRARLIYLSGEPISGRQAYEWGLVEQVVPSEKLLESALSLARTLAARSPHAVAMLKQLARETRDLPLGEGLARERAAFARLLASPDGREGVAAFLEKRAPRWGAKSPEMVFQREADA